MSVYGPSGCALILEECPPAENEGVERCSTALKVELPNNDLGQVNDAGFVARRDRSGALGQSDQSMFRCWVALPGHYSRRFDNLPKSDQTHFQSRSRQGCTLLDLIDQDWSLLAVLDDADVANDYAQLLPVLAEVRASLAVSMLRVRDAWAVGPEGHRSAARKHLNV